MVTRLPEPNIDEVVYLDSVVEERQSGKNASFFARIRNEWKARASHYRQNLGNPELITPWTAVAPRRDTFNNLYSSPADNSTQGGVIATLRARTLQLCPSCGEDGTPNTLDHYLPKDRYPEFSILPQNLLPMCDACQASKGTKTVDAANRRLFIHAYYDTFVDQQIVLLTIDAPYNAPASITLEPATTLNAADADLVRRHLSELEIINRYHRFFRSEYLHLLRIVNILRRTEQDVEQNLHNFRALERLRSVNGWRHIFYSGVLANPDLFAYLSQEQLPEV
jgi:5-methylcytosine-specific restriction endonuclease McrA